MYAQLCKRLSEEAPNFQPPGQPCTFKILLLHKCRTEFENRAQAFAAFEDKALTPDEEEKRHLAKCKMLGNIKFIGELGKLEILAESILHRCIQNLLARRAAAEHHEDLECLAQLVRTCGRVLDSERGRKLMDQYFARIEQLSHARDLAPRIRFMLRDVVELRRGGWVPRAAVSAEGPVPIHQLRADEEPRRDRDRDREPLFRRARPLDDVLAGLSLQPAAPLVPPADKLFGNGFGRARPPPYFGRGGRGGTGGTAPPAGRDARDGREGGARAGKARVYAAGAGAIADVQMRPAANSLMFTANRLSRPPTHLAAVPPSVVPFAPAPALLKENAITIKPANDRKDKPKKDKGVSKEEACRVAVEAVEALAAQWRPPAATGTGDGEGEADAEREGEEEAVRAAAAPLLQLQPPDKVLRRVIAAVLEHAAHAADGEKEGEGEAADGEAEAEAAAEARAWAACALVRAVKRAPLGDALRALAGGAGAARLLAHAVAARLLPLHELGAWCEGGHHHPLLLDVLQRLRALLGEPALRRALDDSKVDLCAYVTEHEGGGGGAEGAVGAERALAALEARGLAALAPQLRVRAALARQLAAEPAPHALYRWIKANVEPGVRQTGAFVSALVALVAARVGAGGAADKAALEREKALVEAYAPLLRALVAGRPELQLAAVYAAQVHAHARRYPKGLLLRWFMYLYNLEVCEEDAFLRWREDVTDAYPGKGEALFQVNAWLTWLQQQESEEEEPEE